ncbi:FAD-dependent monooxygenase [Conexibacter sp. CPCC 206217]|uniref:FAD-dependent monooxygenase n=1 Tax=Conexibacter sp. CPCC 206217 TaxID=3064574 RepID=UPI00271861D4|nr:FAD-dependent monooxygenase [Conexibacter sp. CPCC 206217]MDO8211179.1 FAD-dependent monooxygenase [Conexibacter sp. CPCC 206217]
MSANPAGSPSVLIVGAGPVGLVLACELTRRGVPIRVIDKRAQPTTESRAIVVHARSLELMERVGALDALIASGVRTTAMEMHSNGRTLAHVRLDTVDSPFPFSVTTAQTETERILGERLTALGGMVERGVELVSLEQDDAEVRSTLQHDDGRTEVVSSAWIAGTDGSRSTVRAQVGTRLEGSFKGERFLMGDVETEHQLDPTAIHTFFSAHAAPLIAFPMKGRRMRVIAQQDSAPEGSPDAGSSASGAAPTLAELQAAADRLETGIRLTSSHWLTVFEIHHAQVPQYRHGRAFLAGDAAHVHSPAGGQGMNTGMQDAFNLAWKLALVDAGEAGDALLDSYHAERHPVAARVIELSTKLTDAATLKGTFARKLRNHVVHLATGLAPVQHALANETEEVDVAYRDSPVVAGRSSRRLHPGDAAPDVAGTELRIALLGGSDARAAHTIVSIAPANGGAPALPGSNGSSVADIRHVLVIESITHASGFDAIVPDPDGLIAERYGVGAHGGTVVVRPDGYVGLIAALDDEAAVGRYFDALR